jgi:replicative DNA helicase
MIEELIFSNLLHNEEYSRKVIPFLKDEYFKESTHKVLFNLIDTYTKKYSKFPTKEALYIDLSNLTNINEKIYSDTNDLITSLNQPKEDNIQWLLDQTETFCQEKAVYNAILESLDVLEGDNKNKRQKTAIPQMLSDALAVSFDAHVGLDFLNDAEKLYDFYHSEVSRIAIGLYWFDKITMGGIPDKTLNCIMAPSGVGKSLFLCDFAARNILDGKNVLYITLEMAEERIAERIYANLLDTPIAELGNLSKDNYDAKIDRLKKKTKGKLFIKEFPTASAGASHFRYLINELKMKKNFIPDIIYIDYLNICVSTRYKAVAGHNSYTIVKAIAEELRGLAVEFNCPIWTATQMNRSGYNNSDPDETNTSESIGLVATCDLFIALVTSEELEKSGKIQIKQLKNRYNDIVQFKRFVIGIDRSRMKLYDVDQEESDNYADPPVMDTTTFGQQEENRKKRNFSNFV